MKAKQVRARYTWEFKLEAVRQVQRGQLQPMVARTLGIPKQFERLGSTESPRIP